METNPYSQHGLGRANPCWHGANRSSSSTAVEAVEFGHFRVLLRQRQLLADGVPVELGTRAFDILLALLEADGALVTKEELLDRVWRGVVVSEQNLAVQVCALRKALGASGEFISTEFGRGYRLTAGLRSYATINASKRPARAKLRSGRRLFWQYCRRALECGERPSAATREG